MSRFTIAAVLGAAGRSSPAASPISSHSKSIVDATELIQDWSPIARKSGKSFSTSPLDQIHDFETISVSSSERSSSASDVSSNNGERGKKEKVRIKVAGEIFVTFKSTLERFPETLLGDERSRTKYFNKEQQVYIFNRNRVFFEWVLHYYQSNGDLYIPKTMPVEIIERELLFFGIIKGGGTTSKRTSPQSDEPTRSGEQSTSPPPPDLTIKEKLFTIVTVPYSSILSNIWALVDVALILTSIIAFTTETEPKFQALLNNPNHGHLLWVMFYIDAICVVFFTVDLVIKFACWPNRIDFFKQLLNWCDMIAVGPFYMQLITYLFNGDVHLPSLFVLRMGRVVRLFKLVRRIPALSIVLNIINSSYKELAMLAVLWSLFVYISAAMVFYLENMESESVFFKTMFHSLWWSVVTMGTVGYGDIYPTEVAGKVAGVFVVFGSMIFLTLPMTVIVSKFNEVYDGMVQQEKLDDVDFTSMTLRERIVLIQTRENVIN